MKRLGILLLYYGVSTVYKLTETVSKFKEITSFYIANVFLAINLGKPIFPLFAALISAHEELRDNYNIFSPGDFATLRAITEKKTNF